MTDRIALMGAPGSPYTRKMVALLRYRRLPYRLIWGSHRSDLGLPKPKVQLLPTFYFPNAEGELEAVVDSSPIIRRLETMQAGRSVIPEDPALAFLDALVEDYADEWLTKAMFHYRWHYRADIDKAGAILPRWAKLTASDEEIAPLSQYICERQISRLYVVGSNAATAPIIEASYGRFLDAFAAHMQNGPYTFGARPSAADFGIFGQLTQLATFDPTPMAVSLSRAPSVCAWVEVMEDLSGLEPEGADWVTRDTLPSTFKDLLREIGRSYVPVMLANAAALMAGKDKVETMVEGTPWVQDPFPYQGKCVTWLREARGALAPADRAAVDRILDGTGCEALFA